VIHENYETTFHAWLNLRFVDCHVFFGGLIAKFAAVQNVSLGQDNIQCCRIAQDKAFHSHLL